MAHELESSEKAFFVKQPAWHRLGTVLDQAPSIEQAWQMAYPHYLIETPLKAVINTPEGEVSEKFEGYKGIIRDDGLQIGVVKETFETVQPMQMLEYFRPLLETGLVKLEAGFSLRGGKQMVALAKIESADADIVKGDPIRGYFTLFGGFDGSLAIGGGQTDVRVVCANTLRAAMDAGLDFKFKHTKNVRDRVENAVERVKKAVHLFHERTESYQFLASKKVTRNTQKDYVKELFLTPEQLTGDEPIHEKKNTTINHVIDLLDTQSGIDLVPAIRGTAWQAYNAVTEYITHDYGRTQDNRLQSQFFGANRALGQRAFDNALTM